MIDIVLPAGELRLGRCVSEQWRPNFDGAGIVPNRRLVGRASSAVMWGNVGGLLEYSQKYLPRIAQ